MNRIVFLAGVLILILLFNWVLTVFFIDRLPPTLPLNFGEKPFAIKGPKDFFYAFPAAATVIALVFVGLIPYRQQIPFPGRKRLARMPGEFRETLSDRVYQIILVFAIFVTLVISYLQASIALYSTNSTGDMRIWPVYAVSLVFVAYLIFNFVMVYRVIRNIEDQLEKKVPPEGEP